MLIAQWKVLRRPAHISIKSEGRESSSAAKKHRLEYVKSSWKGYEIYRFSCSATQHFIPRPTMLADIFEEFEPLSKKFLATPPAYDSSMKEFCSLNGLKNLINKPTCWKNSVKPTCIDLILTNQPTLF